MPDQDALKYVVSKKVTDLKDVRLPGASKPFEQMTISELVQLRPGSANADSYNVNAVSSDVTVSSSSILSDLAQAKGQEAVHSELTLSHVRTALGGRKVLTTLKDTPNH